MRNVTPALRTLLDSDTFEMADLIKVDLKFGGSLYWTDYDLPLELAGHVYQPAEWPCVPAVTRGKTRLVLGTEIDSMEITIGAAGAVNLLGTPMPLAAINGAFDDARVTLHIGFMDPKDDSHTIVGPPPIQFSGNVAGVDPSSMVVKLTVKSDLERANIQTPQNIYGPSCNHAVYDAGCGLDKALFMVQGVVMAVTDKGKFFTDRVTDAVDYFNGGVLAFTTGRNKNARRSVADFEELGLFTMGVPFQYEPAIDDAFTVYPGCDKKRATCRDKFNNEKRFRGFPYVPPPEFIR